MMRHDDGSVTLPVEEWATLSAAWSRVKRFLTGAPFTYEDMLDRAERVAYHKASDLMRGIPYDPADWDDEEGKDAHA